MCRSRARKVFEVSEEEIWRFFEKFQKCPESDGIFFASHGKKEAILGNKSEQRLLRGGQLDIKITILMKKIVTLKKL